MREINEIIIHCSATKPIMDVGRSEINQWHKEKGYAEIGYHYVIKRSGTIEAGRNIEKIGAHCIKHNEKSIGICLVGGIGQNGKAENNFTASQFESLKNLLQKLILEFPQIKIYPHNSFTNKDCPCFDVSLFLTKYNLAKYSGV